MNKKKSIKSLSFLWLGSLLGSGSTFLIYMILARKLGPENFGIFSSTLSIITVFTLLAGFGISQAWLKVFGKEGGSGIRWVKPSLHLVFLSFLFVTSAVFIWALYGPHEETTKKLLFILTFFIYGNTSIRLVVSKLQLEENYNFLALWQLLPNLLRFLLISSSIFIFSIPLTSIQVAYIYAFVGIIFTVISMFQLYSMQNGNFNIKGHEKTVFEIKSPPKIKDVLSEAWPFGIASVFSFIYIQSDIILIKYMASNVEAGYYNVAFTVITAIFIFPDVLYSKFLIPKFHRWANHDRIKFYEFYKKGNIAMIISGSIIMTFVLLLSWWFVPFLFGKEYSNSIMIINIFSLTLPAYFMAYSVGATLVTKSHMKLKVKLMGNVALVNIVLNVILIPIYGAIGAAFSTFISNVILASLYYYTAKKKVFNQVANG